MDPLLDEEAIRTMVDNLGQEKTRMEIGAELKAGRADDGWVDEIAPPGTVFKIKGAWDCFDCEGWGIQFWGPITATNPNPGEPCLRCKGKGQLWDVTWYEKSCCGLGEHD